ncbi:MAG: alkaline phosphatase family protein [Bacteroidetes bacterium]|nr:alkaline phosphatase family protein [Bacteroidota bacterium]
MQRKTILSLFISLLFFQLTFAQKASSTTVVKPKLVVGLVIDQMRWDYLYRFNDLYSENGFKRLLKEGFSYENTMIPYTPTFTAPGHTSIYTGSVPAIHGIVGNNWYERSLNRTVYCTDDSTVNTVGTNSAAGKMSPKNMWATTITDELRLSNNFKSKVIGIALKDRGAILPAGHSANAAYWFDTTGAGFISSTHYMKELPDYVKKFNSKQEPAKYMQMKWTTLLPIEKYTASTNDSMDYESPVPGLSNPVFPHDLSLITKEKFEAFKYSPFAATYSFDFAKTVIENEKMGQGAVTDFLALSISSTDYAGHHFGPNSVETEDTYLRLDRDIAGFLQFLDEKFGKGNYLLFLTADHAIAHAPDFLQEHHIPGGMFSQGDLQKRLNAFIEKTDSISNAVLSVQNYQVYINHDKIKLAGKDEKHIINRIIDYIKHDISYVSDVVEISTLPGYSLAEPIKERIINGYNMQRSGDIQIIVKPGFSYKVPKNVQHGVWNPYDAHIPLLFFGWQVQQGKTNRETYMTDIAPTLAAMLQIQMPNGCVGKVLEEMTKKNE